MNLLILQPSVSKYEVLIDFSNKLAHAFSSTAEHSIYQYICRGNLIIENTATEINQINKRFNIKHIKFSFNIQKHCQLSF